jgi:hypothetical protein
MPPSVRPTAAAASAAIVGGIGQSVKRPGARDARSGFIFVSGGFIFGVSAHATIQDGSAIRYTRADLSLLDTSARPWLNAMGLAQ